MTKSELIEMLAERPFTPVLIDMSNGRTHEVRHPENAIVGDYHVALLATRDGEEVIRVISLPHINEVERMPASANGNSKTRKPRKPRN
jgi:hypothetical protein